MSDVFQIKTRRADYIVLGVILLLATILRLIGLSSSLWYDEIVTLVEFVRLPTLELVRTFSSLNNHIFYSLQAQISLAIFGESAWALRLPAVFFGVASIAALWWLARNNSDTARAHAAALLLAVSYHHVWFSQNARGYTGLLFWAIVGTGLFIKGMHNPSWKVWLGYGAAAAAAGYTHLSAGFFFATHGLIYLAVAAWDFSTGKSTYAGTRAIQPVAGFALGAGLVGLLHAPILAQIASAMESVAAPVSDVALTEWKNPVWTGLEVLRNFATLGWVAAVGAPAALLFLAVGTWSWARRQPLLAATFVLNVPLTFLAIWALSFRIWPRYFFVDVAFAFLFVVEGIFVVSKLVSRRIGRVEWASRLGLAASLLAVLCSTVLLPRNYRHPKQDFAGARDFVEASRSPGDQVASIGLAEYPFSKYYAPQWKVVDSVSDIQELSDKAFRLWVVYAYAGAMREHYPLVMNHLDSQFELVRQFPGTLGDGDIFVYRSRARIAR